jgi:hypothetical protein
VALAGSSLYNSMGERKQIALNIATVVDHPRPATLVGKTEQVPPTEGVQPIAPKVTTAAAAEVDEFVRVVPPVPPAKLAEVAQAEAIAWKDCEQMGRGAACNGDANSVMAKDACFAGRECPAVDCLIIPYPALRRSAPAAASGTPEIVWACVENPYSPPKSDPFAPVVCAEEKDKPFETFPPVSTPAPPDSNGTSAADVLSDAPPTANTIETYLAHFQRETSWLFPKWRSWNGTCAEKKVGEAPRQLRARRVAPFDTYVIENGCVSSRGGIRGFNPAIEHGFEGGYEWARGPGTYGPRWVPGCLDFVLSAPRKLPVTWIPQLLSIRFRITVGDRLAITFSVGTLFGEHSKITFPTLVPIIFSTFSWLPARGLRRWEGMKCIARSSTQPGRV